jgi:DNA-binding NtrC family response regulator
MVFGIAQQLGGSVHVESAVDEGTSMMVYFPRIEADLDAAGPSIELPTLRGSETILLVEDQEQVRVVARDILVRHGYTVLVASDACAALMLVEKHRGPIRLLLTDVVMPDMSGAALAQVRPDIDVLYMSGYVDDRVIGSGALDDESAFLQKPFTPESLARKVREVLSRSRSLAR